MDTLRKIAGRKRAAMDGRKFVYVTKALHEKLRTFAKANRVSMMDVVEEVLTDAFDELEGQETQSVYGLRPLNERCLQLEARER